MPPSRPPGMTEPARLEAETEVIEPDHRTYDLETPSGVALWV